MKNNGMKIKHPKLRGEWAELRFMTCAAEHGLCVTKQWGETARYDFAVEHEGHFVRVQVKSTMFMGQGSIALYPRLKKSKYGVYKGAWHLLRGEHRIPRIEASAEEFALQEMPRGLALI